MSAQSNESSQKYLYAITEAGAIGETDLTGIEDQPVYPIDTDGIAVAVSDLGRDDVRPRRRHLKAHHDTIDELIDQGLDILPVSFGVIAKGSSQLRSFLARNRDRLSQQIDRLRNRVEVSFSVAWNVDDLFQHFVEHHEELRGIRDEYFQGGDREPTRQEKVHLGEMFEEILHAQRAAHRERVESHLLKVADQIHAEDCREETDVMRLACLVERDRVEDLEDAIYDAAEEFQDHFLFEYTDPTAPYTFADIEF